MNATIEKFGYPATLVQEFEHWVVLARPQQPTLGALVLAAKSDATAFGALAPAAFAELGEITPRLESALRDAVQFERINYLMLMMVDPHVHFHVIPRYEGMREAAGMSVQDHGWPKLPDLNTSVTPDAAQMQHLVSWLRERWPD